MYSEKSVVCCILCVTYYARARLCCFFEGYFGCVVFLRAFVCLNVLSVVRCVVSVIFYVFFRDVVSLSAFYCVMYVVRCIFSFVHCVWVVEC